MSSFLTPETNTLRPSILRLAPYDPPDRPGSSPSVIIFSKSKDQNSLASIPKKFCRTEFPFLKEIVREKPSDLESPRRPRWSSGAHLRTDGQRVLVSGLMVRDDGMNHRNHFHFN